MWVGMTAKGGTGCCIRNEECAGTLASWTVKLHFVAVRASVRRPLNILKYSPVLPRVRSARSLTPYRNAFYATTFMIENRKI